MSGGLGFTKSGMESGRNNYSLLKNNRSFDKSQRSKLSIDDSLKFKEISTDELTRLKQKIRQNAKNDRIMLFSRIMDVILFIIYLFFMLNFL